MPDRKSPNNWEEETRFDGPEHWGGDPRWKHLFPKSGTPGTFVPVDIDGITVDSTDDEAGNPIDDAGQIDELDKMDAGRSRRSTQQGQGERDQKKSSASRRWRQGKETEPPSSSSRRYSNEEDDAWLFGKSISRSRVKRDLSGSSSEEVEFDEDTAGIVGMESTVDRSKPRRAHGKIAVGSQKIQGKHRGEEQYNGNESSDGQGFEAAIAGSGKTLDHSSSRVRSPGRGSFQKADESRVSAGEDIDSDDSGNLRDDWRKRKSMSFSLSPPSHGLKNMEKATKGSIIRERAGRRAARSSPSESCASKSETPVSGDAGRYVGDASSHESRSGGKKPRARAFMDKDGWIKGAFKGPEAAMRKNNNRRLKQQTLNFPVEVDD